MTEDSRIREVAEWLTDAFRIVALTGAGISTESGIPDFRGPNGVWTKNPEAEKLATLDHYMNDRDARVRSWRSRLESRMFDARPNAGHYALAHLERKQRLDTLVTQNVDGLHLDAGTSPERLIEIHGTVREFMCMRCGVRGPIQEALDRVRAGEEDPPCVWCGGILKSATISFGQNLVADDLERAQTAAITCDVFLAIGTSLGVYPAAYLPAAAVRHGAKLVIINNSETPYDDVASAVFREPIGEVLPEIVEAV